MKRLNRTRVFLVASAGALVLASPAAMADKVDYAYDAAGRLTSANYSNGGSLIRYAYDPAGNILSKVIFTNSDVTSFEDITGDSTPDLAGFVRDNLGRPNIVVYSGATGSVQSTFGFLNAKWNNFAIGTVRDANQDGTANDPAAAVLAVNNETGKMRVEARRVDNGALVSSVLFLNEKWRAVDIVVVDDANGDGNTSDTAVAVLAERLSDGRIQLQLRDLDTGSLISNTVYFNARWTPIAAAVADRSAVAPAGTLPPLISVIAHNAENGKRLMQSRVAGSGAFDQNIKFLGAAWDYQDVSVNHDADGNGTNDDPIWQVLATRSSDKVARVQTRRISDGSFDRNIAVLNANWQTFRLDTSPDIGGSNAQEMVISATRRADGVGRIHVKDYGTGATTINIAP